jgi:hypothetical protein
MMYGRAATVSDRSPPPSCIRRMLPALTLGPVAAWTMRLVPGRLQSRVSIVHTLDEDPLGSRCAPRSGWSRSTAAARIYFAVRGQAATELSRRQRSQIGMVVCVIADIAALGPDLGRLCGVLDLSEAELEECGRGVRGCRTLRMAGCTGSVLCRRSGIPCRLAWPVAPRLAGVPACGWLGRVVSYPAGLGAEYPRLAPTSAFCEGLAAGLFRVGAFALDGLTIGVSRAADAIGDGIAPLGPVPAPPSLVTTMMNPSVSAPSNNPLEVCGVGSRDEGYG